MAVPWQAMTNIRRALRRIVGNDTVDESYFTFDRDTQQIVSNTYLFGYHWIFDSDGNLIKYHVEP